MERSLDDLAMEYGTDKSSLHHNYTEIYERSLSSVRHSTRGVIELGIGQINMKGGTGASLQMWRDYFSNAQIIGIDIDKKTNLDFGERISVVIGDQTRQSVLEKACSLISSVDIIIDDASHINQYTIATFEYLFDKLRPGGLYFIEDTLCNNEWTRQNMRSDMENFIIQLVRGIETNGRLMVRRNCADFKKIKTDWVMNRYERWVESIEITRGIYIIRKRAI